MNSTAKRRSKRSPRVVALGIALIITVLLLVDIGLGSLVTWWTTVDPEAVERGYRQASEHYHHDLRPNIRGRGIWGKVQYEVVTNSLGFKDGRNRDVPLEAEGERIVFLGDSFTEGLALPYAQTFVGMVDAALRPDGYDVLNAGVLSYCPLIYWRKAHYLLEEKGLKFKHLVVFIDISDIEDEAVVYRMGDDMTIRLAEEWAESERQRRAVLDHAEANRPLTSRLIEVSLTLRMLDSIKTLSQKDLGPRWPETVAELERTLHLVDPRVAWTFDDVAYAQVGVEGLRRASKHMDELHSLVKRHGIQLYVAVYPWPGVVVRGARSNRHNQHWKAWSEAHGVPFLDITEAFMNDEDPMAVLHKYYIPDDSHFNKAGNEVIAERFLAFWRTRNDGEPRERHR